MSNFYENQAVADKYETEALQNQVADLVAKLLESYENYSELNADYQALVGRHTQLLKEIKKFSDRISEVCCE